MSRKGPNVLRNDVFIRGIDRNRQKDTRKRILSIKRAKLLDNQALVDFLLDKEDRDKQRTFKDLWIQEHNLKQRIKKIRNVFRHELNEPIKYKQPRYTSAITGVHGKNQAQISADRQRQLSRSEIRSSKTRTKIELANIKELLRQKNITDIQSRFRGNVSRRDLASGLELDSILEENDEKDILGNTLEGVDFENLLSVREAVRRQEIKQEKQKERRSQAKKGSGLSRPRGRPITTDFLQFGRFLIDRTKLLNRNVLSLRFNNAIQKPRLFPNRNNVSHLFKKKILQLVEGKNIDISVFDAEDKQWFKKFIKASEVTSQKISGGGVVDDIEKVVNRFDVLVSEIMDGNTAKKKRNELSKIINTLIQKGVITAQKGIAITKKLIKDV